VLLAGGVFIVLEHAVGLAQNHGHEVTIVQTHDDSIEHRYPHLDALELRTIDEVEGRSFDVAVATWWDTVYFLPRVHAAAYSHFVQSLEDRFYPPHQPAARLRSGAVQVLPVSRIVSAGWLETYFRLLLPDTPVYCVRSGIDKSVFAGPAPGLTLSGAPLRIVIEGPPDVWFKAVPEAIEAVERMSEPHHLTLITGRSDCPPALAAAADHVTSSLSHSQMADVFATTHVLLKLSRVEGMAGPPLEAFHMGATAVVTPVTGHEEYIRHGHNAIVVGYDDPFGTTRALDLLGRDRSLLHTLRSNAHRTAAEWPDWRTATQSMAAALEDLSHHDARVDTMRQLILEIDGITGAHLEAEVVRRERDELRATLNLIFGSRGWKLLERVRHLLGRT
jgi:glycosyltransferase involved in cell wall biosynthesis